MIPSDFAFHVTSAGYLLFLLPLLLLFFFSLYLWRQKVLTEYADVSLQSETLIPRSNRLYWGKCIALLLTWTLATLALMQPQGNAHYSAAQPPKAGDTKRLSQEIILLIDTSGSMAVADSRSGLTRLDDAKDIADQIVSRLQGETVSLYAFTSEVTPLSPATLDYLFVRLMLRQMKLNEGDVAGTDIEKTLHEMHRYLLSMPPTRLKRLILISDGGDTALDLMPAAEREKAIGNLLDLFDDAPSLNLRVDAIGIGSRKGGNVPEITYQGRPVLSSLQEELLRRLARRGRGLYIEANAQTAPTIADRIASALKEEAAHAPAEAFINASSRQRDVLYDRYFQIPLALALLFTLFLLLSPDARRRRQ